MTSYKLSYFGFRGRGEIVRLVFAAADVKYEDHLVEKEEWAKLNAGTDSISY